jgi:hypothetical protein
MRMPLGNFPSLRRHNLRGRRHPERPVEDGANVDGGLSVSGVDASGLGGGPEQSRPPRPSREAAAVDPSQTLDDAAPDLNPDAPITTASETVAQGRKPSDG